MLDLGWGKISIYRGVYEPSDDTWLLLELLEKHDGVHDTCIETCAGTGVLGTYLLASGKCRRIIFVDVNHRACMNTLHNLELNDLLGKGVVLNSLSLKPVKGKCADLIVFNPPYLPGEPRDLYDMGLVGGRRGYETIADIVSGANSVLRYRGHMFFVYSSLTGRKKVVELLARNGFKIVRELRKHVFFEDIFAVEAILVEDKGCTSGG